MTMPTPRVFRVTVNLARLRGNLSAQEGRTLSAEEVLQWLADAGFEQRDADGWEVNEEDLGQLKPAEIITAEAIDAGWAEGGDHA